MRYSDLTDCTCHSTTYSWQNIQLDTGPSVTTSTTTRHNDKDNLKSRQPEAEAAEAQPRLRLFCLQNETAAISCKTPTLLNRH